MYSLFLKPWGFLTWELWPFLPKVWFKRPPAIGLRFCQGGEGILLRRNKLVAETFIKELNESPWVFIK